jgi:LacI family transcriptional regulator
MVTLTDVAKAAGVSVATASMVLNPGKGAGKVGPERSERVRVAAARLGYFGNYHARAMQVGRAETIGLALDFGAVGAEPSLEHPMGGEYFHHLTMGVESYTHYVGFNLALIGPSREERGVGRGVRQIMQRRLDGLVVPGVLVRDERGKALSEGRQLPLVVVEHPGIGDIPVVDYDEIEGLRRAITHLAELGHRDLLWLGPGEDSYSTTREQHFIKLVWDAGLRGQSCRYLKPLGEHRRTAIADYAKAALLGHLEKPRTFTAVMCYNDITAVGAYAGLRAAGLQVPGDVSVVGFDDFCAAVMLPRLTTVSHMLVQMGKRAAEMVIAMAASEQALAAMRGKRELLVPELIVRDSTGPMKSP